ncbi:uncharacterized protein LOC115950359 [Quercus lobata]|uniref:uncharacterized protein LOC115950359 n=1 Tax=Quercus lobata TaxID=97700 RepID=UPI001246CA4F|nr:uncharacterized protein LOC115950359 [Quercus lobata]
MVNEIDDDFNDVAISTFKLGLPSKHGLWNSLTGKPLTSIRQLMDRIDKYKRVEEDRQQDKGKGKVIPQERRDFRLDRYSNNKTRRDFAGQSEPAAPQVVSTIFRESVHQILEKIKNEPYFRWSNKMGGDSLRRNRSLHCLYHQEWGHTIEDCRTLWNHLEQLVKEGRLQQFLYQPNGQRDQSRTGARGNAPPRPTLGTINVIFAAPGKIGSHPTRVMSIARSPTEDPNSEPKKARLEIRPSLSFSDKDKIGTIQPHDDALVVTLKIGGYDVKRVMVAQGS